MDIIRWAINKPVSVSVGVLLVVLFGLIGLTAIPIQLTPTVDRPIITVTTAWPGRSPQEVVDEVTRKQEEQLKNVSNLKTMRSISRQGGNEVTLEFYIGSNINRALQEVSDSLRQVEDYPEEVDEPAIKAAEGAAENAIAWIIIDLDPAVKAQYPDFDISTIYTAMDREVKPYLERVDGVAEVNIYGGREMEIQVKLDQTRLALRSLTHAQVIDAIQRENRDVSAGTIAEGKRDIRVRVLGRFTDTAQVLDTVVAYRDGKPVYVRDIGEVDLGHQKARGFVRSLGEPCLAMNVIRQSNANVMTVMEDVRGRLEEVRAEILPRLHPVVGPHLRMRQVYDETTYIDSAVELVLGNLWKGGLLAIIVLVVFLRSARATGVIAMAIPISVIGTFLVILAAGRTLNVISLAGLAFATGMVVDNAIVVLENIVRRRALGDPPALAVYRGAREVWGAILASTLTTVCVFIPILTIREEAGQLFFDLSLAMAVAVVNSLVVAITVVPAACNILFGTRRVGTVDRSEKGSEKKPSRFSQLFGIVPLFARFAAAVAGFVHWLITGWRSWTLRPVAIIVLAAGSIFGAYYLAPPLDYLPPGNRNLVFGGLLIPPGLSVEQQREIAQSIESKIKPYVEADLDDPASLEKLPPIRRFDKPNDPFDPMPVDNFFIGAFQGGMFVGGTSQDPQVVIPVGSLFTNAMTSIPDSFGGAQQSSIFGRGVGGGNTIDLEISGPDIRRVTAAAQMMLGIAGGKYGWGSVRPDPANFNLTQPETRVRVNDLGRELGLRTADVGVAVRGLFDGAFAGEYILDGRNIDIMVLPEGGRLETLDRLTQIPVATPAGPVVPLSSVVEIVPARAEQEIQRIEELPAVTLRIQPPQDSRLEDVMAQIREEIIGPATQAGLIDRTMRIRLEGTAAKLDEVKASLFGAAPTGDSGPITTVLNVVSAVIAAAGIAVAAFCLVRSGRRRSGSFVYGAIGALLMALIVGGALFSIGQAPQLLTARFIWALLVTYLLMCALFESFLYPLVIMFSVPLAVVGGFLALKIVHDWTVRMETIAPQQLDVLTMIGFVILIGTVVNNAILVVEQTLNFMVPGKAGEAFEGDEALPPMLAIKESVRTRLRPIFMTALTTLGGGLPLVLAPGAGSEMYRGLGAVVCGGLLVSTIFTLLLVPLTLSLVFDMKRGLQGALGFSTEIGRRAFRPDQAAAQTVAAGRLSGDGMARGPSGGNGSQN